MKRHSFVLSTLAMGLLLLAGGSASATSFSYTVVNGGLDDGHACLSSAGTCSTSSTFEIGPTDSFPISGYFTYDDVADTIDIDITLATATMFGSHDGITEVIFTSVNYVVSDIPVFVAAGGSIFAGTNTGTVTGTYEQSDGTITVVGPDAINELSTIFSAFSCSNLDAVGLCGFTVGGSRDFALNVGETGFGDSTDFVHTFNFNVVIPEPASASLLALGLVAFAAVPRFRS